MVQCKRGRLCVRVDEAVGHRQVLISALKDILPNNTKLTGAAQLDGDRLTPVLNVPEIVKGIY